MKDRKKVLRTILLTLIVILLILTIDSLRRLSVLFIFVIVNFLIAFSKRYIPTWQIRKYFMGVEGVMFCTVITSVTFGPKIGAVMGALLMTVNYIAEKRFSQYFPLTLTLYTLIGYSAYFFREVNIIILGLSITILYNILSTIIVSFFGANKRTMLMFNLVNILFNLFLFSTFGGFFLGFL